MIKAVKRYFPVLVGIVLLIAIAFLFPSTVASNSQNFVLAKNLIPKQDAPGTVGKMVNGRMCGPGVPQIYWSSYSPECQPAFSGNNGGSTSYGVTSKTITITFRYALPPQYQALLGLLGGGSVIGSEQQAVSTMDAYVSLFNKNFELYGRKVVLKPFTGKGDLLSELGGGGLAQAQSDAAEAKSLGAFADVSLIFSTAVYDQALAQNHVIAITGGIFQSKQWFNDNAPYVYSVTPYCNQLADAAAGLISRSMNHLPAIFSNSPSIRKKQRVFGLIYPSNPQYQSCANQFTDSLSRKHVSLARVISYPFSLTGATELSQNTIEQLINQNVTTVLCACDPITPIFLANDSANLNYYPEWFTLDWGDSFAQTVIPSEWAHAVSGGQPAIPKNEQEAYKALLLANLTPKEINPLYSDIYLPLLMLFDALQEAGPDLNPQTFEQGYWSLPQMSGPLTGVWKFGVGTFEAQASYEILWYDPTAISNQDSKPGAWVPCNNGQIFLFSQHSKELQKGVQLSCGNRGGPGP
jgi:hypothetical protein